MAGHPGTRPHTGAPPRTVSMVDLLDERKRLLALPRSAERKVALRRLRRAIERIGMRSERNGA